jgi:hypothetical protein
MSAARASTFASDVAMERDRDEGATRMQSAGAKSRRRECHTTAPEPRCIDSEKCGL